MNQQQIIPFSFKFEFPSLHLVNHQSFFSPWDGEIHRNLIAQSGEVSDDDDDDDDDEGGDDDGDDGDDDDDDGDGGGGDDDIGVVVNALVQCGPYLQNLIIVSDFRHLQQIYSNFNFWC